MSRSRPSIVAIALVIGAATPAACGSSGSNSGSAGYRNTPSATTGPAMGTTTVLSNSTTSATIRVAHDAKLGDYLVDGKGRTLYLFEADHGLKTACTGSCATAWPAATAARVATGKGIDPKKLTTVSGAAPNQLAFAGHLLYRFSGDTAPGDTNGVGIPQWYAVAPNGTAIETD